MRVLVSGANGFVGKALCAALTPQHQVFGITRQASGALPKNVSAVVWRGNTEALDELPEMDAVVHLAARVHVMNEHAEDPLAEFRAVNVDTTRNLAQWAASRCVRRFIFMSSIKVNGEVTLPGQRFSAEDAPAPEDDYALSKFEAEQVLRRICEGSGMKFVVIRPPLVYGPNVKANFGALIRAVQRGLPLPLGAVTDNRRSLVGIDNLVDLLVTCLNHPAAAHQTFLVSDGEDLSTADLVRRLGRAMNRPARLIPVPSALLHLGAALLGRRDQAHRLLGNLQIDIAHTRTTLCWTPPVSVDDGLRYTVAGRPNSL
jgi:nucleoside-diphosphate-sugar epimerase